MKLKTFLVVVLAALLAACDDTTEDIGTSLLPNMDRFDVTTDTFNVASRSIVADSVYSRTTTGYLGRVRDPETGAYITGHFMTQFHVLEDYAETFPAADSIMSRIDGTIVADSCEIRLYYDDFYGDSLATMKVSLYEMDKPMYENQLYYSSFNPIKEGDIRADGLRTDKTYALADMTVSLNERSSTGYTRNIRVMLNQPYTDANGITYNNYGTYILNTFYKNPEAFGNSLKFMKEVVPGFYFQSTGGLGSMAYINLTQLNVYFRFTDGDGEQSGVVSFAGTEEILQTTTVENDRQCINQLAGDNTCTYLKTPAGIFTELTLPVDEIMNGHDNDSINSAKIIISRINDNTETDFNLQAPSTLLMIPKDSLYTFFENNQLADNRCAFLSTSAVSSTNSYIFYNISNLITKMATSLRTEDWNKVVLVPVTVDTNSSKISHDMSLSSTRLIGGSANPYKPVSVSVVYSKFK